MSPEQAMQDMLDATQNRYFGKYQGIVRNNVDDEDRGRLEVQVPRVMGDQLIWAMPCVPYAGQDVGSYLIPEIGSGVWIEFEAGDLSRPIWVGCFWADDQLPKNETGKQGIPPLKIIRTKKGLMVTMNDDKQVITVSDKGGDNQIKIEVQKGQITVKGVQKVVVEAPKIELVENSTHPVVFGDELLRYLNQLVQIYNTHTHPAELVLGVFPITPAPPVPPYPPATPVLISKRVTSG